MIGRMHTRLFASLCIVGAMVVAIAGCGSDEEGSDGETTTPVTPIESSPENQDVKLTIGSLDSTEQRILGEIYAQGLEAAGYDVSTDLGLASPQDASDALQDGTISGYPENIFPALTTLLDYKPEDVPAAGGEARDKAIKDFEKEGLVALSPTGFESSPALALPVEAAQELGVESYSDLKKEARKLKLAGPADCPGRFDCLAGLEQNYGLEFASFTPADDDQSYALLDKGDADVAVVTTTDPELFEASDKYRVLNDDEEVMPAGNLFFVAPQEVVEKAGPGFAETVARVQRELSLPVMQELNAKVDIDEESPKQVAREYLEDNGYIE
jgi:osmoprotectant transport system substrate-binding protein